MTSPLDRVLQWLEAHDVAVRRTEPDPAVEELLSTVRPAPPAALVEVYQKVAPGCEQLFSPVDHNAVLTSWPLWPLETSAGRLERSSDPLWQLTPAIDVWLDTHEVTILRKEDHDESFPTFEAYWENRLAELEASHHDPLTRLWLPPHLRARRVELPDGFAGVVLQALGQGSLHLPGLGTFHPSAPPAPGSAWDHSPQGPGPSWVTEGLDGLDEPSFTDIQGAARAFGRSDAETRNLLQALHTELSDALDRGPVDFGGLFRVHARHHPARTLQSGDEVIEQPAYRQVTARVALDFADRFREDVGT